VIVIDVEMVEENVLVTRRLYYFASGPVFAADRATTVLLLKDELQRFERHPVLSQEVRAPRLFAPQRIAPVVFAIVLRATRTTSRSELFAMPTSRHSKTDKSFNYDKTPSPM
jgi:hypothetical protein